MMRIVFLFFFLVFSFTVRASAQELPDVAEKDRGYFENSIRDLQTERDLLIVKIEGLQKGLLECDASLSERVQRSIRPFETQAASAQKEIRALQFALDEKSRVMEQQRASLAILERERETVDAERTMLRGNLQSVSAELDKVKTDRDEDVRQERKNCDEKTRDLQARLAAEQTLVKEKVGEVKGPLEAKLTDLENKLKEKDRDLKGQIASLKAELDKEMKEHQKTRRALEDALKKVPQTATAP
ncbi:MAG: hypothetical protein GX606_02380 [Elusimicrobia bacterium]|nr:hypothetical protein [Elusimicrobiota bacterium]